jgi:hypothetical protein
MQLLICQVRRRPRKGCTRGRRVSSVYPRAILPEGFSLTFNLMMSEAVVDESTRNGCSIQDMVYKS